MRIKSQRDFFAGVMFAAVGTAFAWAAAHYNLGTAGRMGPGYFPLVLGILLALLGVVLAVKAQVVETEDGEPVGAIAWKPLLFVIGANVLFGLALGGLSAIGLPPLGLILGIYALVFVASLAGETFHWREVLILATVLAIFCYVAFVKLLKLQFPVWPAFITG